MSRGVTAKTPERVAQAQAMREAGMTYRAIAQTFGISKSTVCDWILDPDLTASRARKDSYAATCVDCGEPTSGSEGRREEPRCVPCAKVKSGAEAKIWTRPAILLAIEEWVAEYGESPAIADWNPYLARHILHDEQRAARWERDNADGKYPSFKGVVREFGSWNAGIAAAGRVPRASHGGGGNEQRMRSMRAKAAA